MTIEHQHKALEAIVEQITTLVSNGTEEGTLLKLLMLATKALKKCHLAEEKEMIRENYPDFTKHKKSHAAIVKDLLEFQRNLRHEIKRRVTVHDTLRSDWLEHRKVQDATLLTFLKGLAGPKDLE